METTATDSTLTRKQAKKFGPRAFKYCDTPATITAEVRFDDECGNGHNTFAITADIRGLYYGTWLAGGCCHEEIAKVFPELAPFIKWHLCSTDGPMHYISNTVFLAGNRDCWGKLKGEPKQWETAIKFGKNPIPHKFSRKFTDFLRDASPKYDFEVLAIEHGPDQHNYKFSPKYTFGGFADKWHECPFDSEQEALDFLLALQTCEPSFWKIETAWGEGKERELASARSAAVWPDATDEELTAPELKERLEARLPGLLAEFRAAVESLGFVW